MSQLTMPEFEAALAKTTTVIVPFGSVEEHGPHLPLSTDTMHAQEVASAGGGALSFAGGAARALWSVPLHQ